MPSCATCTSAFVIHPDETAFLQKMTFRFGATDVQLPPPIFCPDCRCKRRTCYRNEQSLHKIRSAFSGKDVISIFAETPPWGEPYKIYDQDEWRSDAWDPMDYGRDPDLSKPILGQLATLQKDVPRMALITLGNENSAFTTGTAYCKNCYLINSSEYCEDCYYGKLLQKCQNAVDCSYLYDSQHCYECFSVYTSYGCQYLSFSQNCQDCFFSSNLKGCKNCCLCTNLDHKEYHFQNQPLSKQEYEARLATFRGSLAKTEQMKTLWRTQLDVMVRKYANIVNSDNCSGDYIEHSRNCLDCYDVNSSEDCRYVQVGVNVKDNYDASNMYLKSELCYDTLGTIECHTVAYCLFVFHSQRLLYCDYCFSCSDCFGCSGLTRKKHCVFNKQYTKEEYETLVPKIIEHMKNDGGGAMEAGTGKAGGSWGLFYLPQYSMFAYNESLASEYFVMERDAAVEAGFHWRETDQKNYRPQSATIPDGIDGVPESIVQEILACRDCRKNFRIVPQELEFYRSMIVPVPQKCPDCRHRARMQLRNPRKLWDRQCGTCGKGVQSTYAPDRPEKILCENCYLKEVY
jgi:hypothetical protein